MNCVYYPNDSFPDLGKLRSISVITDDNGEIITAGGVELIAEGISITNKDFSAHTRSKALLELLHKMTDTCKKLDQKFLHVFVTDGDQVYVRALQTVGFKISPGVVLYKEL